MKPGLDRVMLRPSARRMITDSTLYLLQCMLRAKTREVALKPTRDCIQIAAAGGGLDLSSGGKPTDDLVQIAAAMASASKGANLWISGNKPTEDLIKIVSAGKGCVVVKL